ncbi:hypothetical protein Q8A73_005422 [Channa argus]|nr:hypothetical protein Q8A73_005422 [Channa argus]
MGLISVEVTGIKAGKQLDVFLSSTGHEIDPAFTRSLFVNKVSEDPEHLPAPLGKSPEDVVSYFESVEGIFLCQKPEHQHTQTAHSATEAERRRRRQGGEVN